jgi:phosphate acyltransferase
VTRIAVDAMGGDNAPAAVVRGAIEARSSQCELVLVGQTEVIEREVQAAGASLGSDLRLVDAREVVYMNDSPSVVVRRKRASSQAIAIELVKSGEVDAAVSAGNSGAMMALALVILGRTSGVERPAIAAELPIDKGKMVLLLDAGANVDCSPENLLQFGLMGSEFYECVHATPHPKVALLNIGEEEGKGNAAAREAAELLKASTINFVGNVEGSHMLTGEVDVVVCDGFVGNIALKVAEGTVDVMRNILRSEFERSRWRRALGAISRPVFRDLTLRTSYEQYGGAPLLGVDGVCIVSHGRSSYRAIASAIREAEDAVLNGVVAKIRTAIEKPLTPA